MLLCKPRKYTLHNGKERLFMKKIKFKWNGRVVALAFASIALVMLLSVSYAYFVSKVEGNEDAKATDITAGKMELEYDGTSIVGMENALPGDKKVITFTVRNKGTVTTQYNVDLINVTNEFIKDELVYSIKRNGKDEKGETPLPGSETTLLEGVSIEKDETDTYELTIEFKETYSEQNYNQGKEFNGLIQINGYKPKPLNEWIIANYPMIEEEPNFKKGFPKDDTPEDEIIKGSGLYKTADDYGGTSYIFRGQVDNNYVHFANQDWKILRVNGDGTIRLMLKDKLTNTSHYNDYTYKSATPQHDKVGFTRGGDPCPIDNPCEVTYDNVSKEFTNENGGINSTIKTALEEWYKTNLNDFDEQIAYGLFCNDISYGSGTDDMTSTNILHYGAYERINYIGKEYGNPTLICPVQVDSEGQTRTYGGLYKTKIGLITADELNMGGYSWSDAASAQNYLSRSYDCWAMSPISTSDFTSVFLTISRGYLSGLGIDSEMSIVPVINLKTDNITYSGSGIEDDPIEIVNK